ETSLPGIVAANTGRVGRRPCTGGVSETGCPHPSISAAEKPLAGHPAAARITRRPRQMIKQLCVGIIAVYRVCISPWLGPACRFEPTCSAYASQAVFRFGVI